MSTKIQTSILQPSVVGRVIHRKDVLLDTEPSANNAYQRQKGPLHQCQDNTIAAIVKSQGYCIVDFCAIFQSPAQCSRDTLQYKHIQILHRYVTELDSWTAQSTEVSVQ